jgi:hypothetical protein
MWILKDIIQYIKSAVDFFVACTNEMNLPFFNLCLRHVNASHLMLEP